MFIYIAAILGTVVLTSGLLIIILRKINFLNYGLILAVSLSSILACIIVPEIFNLLSNNIGDIDSSQLYMIFAATLIILMILIFIFSLLTTFVVPKNLFTLAAEKHEPITEDIDLNAFTIADSNNGNESTEKNYIEEIYRNSVIENEYINEEVYNNVVEDENILEKSVDSEKNIDKMGLEAFKQDIPANLSVEACIEEAFKFKTLGDFESSILYFMYALDKNPGKALIFWIVLDICVLYKSLGQIELAKDILNSYSNSYSDYMDAEIRQEINRNLQEM